LTRRGRLCHHARQVVQAFFHKSGAANAREESLPAAPTTQDAGEFKIEIRKLEIPVRPRGVLAE
jgi:hypothetical protein